METKKSRAFSHKLIALFLAVLMALSSFTGALTAFAASNANDKNYHDGNLAANFMTWAETTDEQTAEALLDWADMHLGDLISGLLGSDHLYFSQSVVVATIKIDAYIDSVDGLFDLLQQADDLLDSYGNLVGGDVKNVNLNAVGDDLGKPSGASISKAYGVVNNCAYRANYSAKELVMALAKFLYQNSNDFSGKNIIGQFIGGTFSLGSIIEGVLKGDVYGLLQGALGMWDGYQWNLVYNIVANLILSNTKWFTEAEVNSYKTDLQKTSASARTYAWNFDKILVKALNEQFLNQIHVEVTYNNMVTEVGEDGKSRLVNDSSVKRYKRIVARMHAVDEDIDMDNANSAANMAAFNAAAAADAAENHYTINDKIKYFSKATANESATADFSKDTGCVFLFQYINNPTPVTLDVAFASGQTNDNLFKYAFEALEVAWTTVLKDTIGLLHANYNVDRSPEAEKGTHGNHFDNEFYYWVEENVEGGWIRGENWKNNYSSKNVTDWADAVHEMYNFPTSAKFLDYVKHTYDYDRNLTEKAEGEKHDWKDIDSTTLFNKLRYNPLADLYFNIQTGPINLYFSQTGTPNIDTFFATAFTDYANMVAGLNDALVAATKDIFVVSSNGNIGMGSQGEKDARKPLETIAKPTMATTGNTIDKATIATTLVGNVMDMFEYAANVTDANIMATYYDNHNITATSAKADNLSETNFEEAMIPLLIACLQNITMTQPIHDEKWDACKDAEGVAIVALEEYLSFVLPDKDYSILWTYDANGYITAGTVADGFTDFNDDNKIDLFNDALLVMARDAVSYWVQSIVPCRDKQWREWDVNKRDVTDKTSILDILNSVIVYYAGYEGTKELKGVASLLGVVDGSGNCLVTKDNDIWENIDAIINTLLPAIGTAEFGTTAYWGHASSKTLIWDDLVNGILEISDTRDSFNKKGITNLLMRLITIITSDPVSNNNGKDNMIVMVYDLLADVINGIFGARYTGQGYTNVVPYAAWYGSADGKADTQALTPFDSLLTTSTLAHYSVANGSQDKYDTGVFGILICNIYEAFGGGGYDAANKAQMGTKGCWQGAMFAVDAVNNFIPSFAPGLSDHSLSAATAVVANPSMSSLKANSSFPSTTLNITNNANGLNRFWRDEAGAVHQDDRYFMQVTNIQKSASNNDASNITLGATSGIVAPGETWRVPVTGSAPNTGVLYTFTITYNLFKAKTTNNTNPSSGTPYKIGLKTQAYMYLTNATDWASSLYTATYTDSMTSPESARQGTYAAYGSSHENTDDTLVKRTAAGGNKSRLTPTLPKDFIVKISDPGAIYDYGILIRNTSNIGGGDCSYDGVYVYPGAGDSYAAVTNGAVAQTTNASGETVDDIKALTADNNGLAYAAIDRTNGDILNYELYDYFDPRDNEWKRGTKSADSTSYDGNTYNTKNQHQGYTEAEIQSIGNTVVNGTAVKDMEGFKTRPHVVLTFAEGCASGLIVGVNRDKAAVENGVQTYVYNQVVVTPNVLLLTGKTVNEGKNSISFGTPTPGLYLCARKCKVTKNKNHYTRFMNWDGTTELSQTDYSMKVRVYASSGSAMVGTINMHVADDSGSSDLQRAYNEALKSVATYSPSDFTDYVPGTGGTEGTSATYTAMQQALQRAVQAVSTPINGTNASSLGSKMESVAVTSETESELSKDIAYMPVPTSVALPSSMQVNAFKGSNGYWYADKDFNIPIYYADEAHKVKAADVSVGQLPNGDKVRLGNDGEYHLINAPVYEQKWFTSADAGYSYLTAPIWADTATQKISNKSDVDKYGVDAKYVYQEISFVYRSATGDKVTSKDNPAYKLAEATSRIKPNSGSTDNRGVYQKEIDNANYNLKNLKDKVNTAFADKIGKLVSEERQGMNNVNFNVASYEKMVQIAKDAEKLIWSEKDEEQSYYYVLTNKDDRDTVDNRTVVTLSPRSTPGNTLYEDEDGKTYKNEDVKEYAVYEYKTDRSSLEINAAYDMFVDFYLKDEIEQGRGRLISRGYIGDKLEDEIECATGGYAYTALDYDKDTITITPSEGDPYDVTVSATITSPSATSAKYGAWVNGELKNEGETIYTEESWNAYTAALAEAIEVADAQEAAVSRVYDYKTNLQKAENNLTEAEPEPSGDTITISGKIAIATDLEGTEDNGGIRDIDIMVGNEVVATSRADGSFTAVVPVGTTTLKIHGASTIDRTVTLTGTKDISNVNIPVCICDYNPDGIINAGDTAQYGSAIGMTSRDEGFSYNFDLNPDGIINGADTAVYGSFIGQKVVYADLSLD